MAPQDDVEAWLELMEARMPPEVRASFRKTYRLLHGLGGTRASAPHHALCELAVGHPPRSYEDYCRWALDGWGSEGCGRLRGDAGIS